MIPIADFIDAILKDKHVSEEEKRVLSSIYFISLYKVFLELLIGLKGADEQFVKRLTIFFDEEWKQLQPAEQAAFIEVFAQNKKNILDNLEKVINQNADKNIQK